MNALALVGGVAGGVGLLLLDLDPLPTYCFNRDDIERAYEVSANQRDTVLKVAITP